MEIRNKLLNALGQSVLREVLHDLRETVLPLGRVIFEVGQRVDQVYFPTSGVVSMVVTMANGQAVESQTIGFEGALGLVAALCGGVAEQRATIQIAGSAWAISAERLHIRAGRHPVVGDVAMRYAHVTEAALHQSAACNAVHHIEARLCRWLLTCQDRVGDSMVPLTQELLAMMVGAQRTSVTLAAQAVQRKGLIDYARGRITVLDRAGLEAAACECYDTNRTAFDRSFPPGLPDPPE